MVSPAPGAPASSACVTEHSSQGGAAGWLRLAGRAPLRPACLSSALRARRLRHAVPGGTVVTTPTPARSSGRRRRRRRDRRRPGGREGGLRLAAAARPAIPSRPPDRRARSGPTSTTSPRTRRRRTRARCAEFVKNSIVDPRAYIAPGFAGRDAAELRAVAEAAADRRPRRVPDPGPLILPEGSRARSRWSRPTSTAR